MKSRPPESLSVIPDRPVSVQVRFDDTGTGELARILDREAGLKLVDRTSRRPVAAARDADVVLDRMVDLTARRIALLKSGRRHLDGDLPAIAVIDSTGAEGVWAAVRSGFRGALMFPAPTPQLMSAIVAVARGGAVVTPRLLGAVLERSSILNAAPRWPARQLLRPLTGRDWTSWSSFRMDCPMLTSQQNCRPPRRPSNFTYTICGVSSRSVSEPS